MLSVGRAPCNVLVNQRSWLTLRHELLCGDARAITGRFLLDEDVLRNAGVRDFDAYQYAPERR